MPRKGFNHYRIEGGVAYLALTGQQGEVVGEALVDVGDLPFLLALGHRWCAMRTAAGLTYAASKRCTLLLHRVLMNPQQGQVVDHANGNPLDNRRANMRLASKADNGRNRGRPRNNTSGYKGVTRLKGSSLWAAQIKAEGRNRWLGTFTCPVEAARAYDAAARELHGKFAYQNFPTPAQPEPLARPA